MVKSIVLTDDLETKLEDVARLTRVVEVTVEDVEYYKAQMEVAQARLEVARSELQTAHILLASTIVEEPVVVTSESTPAAFSVGDSVEVINAVNYFGEDITCRGIYNGFIGRITDVYSDGDLTIIFETFGDEVQQAVMNPQNVRRI